MLRPHPTRRRFAVRALCGIALGATALAVAGCADPNYIGIQDYGSVQGNVVDGSGRPVNDALVSIGGTIVHTVPDGSFTLVHIPVGEQNLTVSAGGYGPPSEQPTVIVKKDQTASAGNIIIPSTSAAVSSPATNRP